jgi:hypothetical protein
MPGFIADGERQERKRIDDLYQAKLARAKTAAERQRVKLWYREEIRRIRTSLY